MNRRSVGSLVFVRRRKFCVFRNTLRAESFVPYGRFEIAIVVALGDDRWVLADQWQILLTHIRCIRTSLSLSSRTPRGRDRRAYARLH